MAKAKVKAKPRAVPKITKAGGNEQALLAAIWANPDDRATLAIYADLLAQRGDSRGEYIQLSLLDNPTTAQSDRAVALRKKDRGAWLGAARPFVRSWSDSNDTPGFADVAWCEADKLIAGFDALLTLGPRCVLSVTSMRKQRRQTEKKMAALPLAKVYDLDLGSNALDDAAIETLAPGLAGIRGLQLAGNEITKVGYAALGARVDSLEFLQVGAAVKYRQPERDALVDGITEAIATTPGFRSLRYLQFFRTGEPSAARVKQLKAALPNLQRLSVSEYTEWRGREPNTWAADRDNNR